MLELNKIYLGDCLEVMKEIPDGSVDCILTDPPYGYLKHKLDAPFEYELCFKEFWRVLKDDSSLCFFGRGMSFHEWNYICKELGFGFKEELIWEKQSSTSQTTQAMRYHETLSVLEKGKRNLNRVYIDKIEYDMMSNEGQKIISDFKRLVSDIKKIETYEDFVKWQTEKKEHKLKHYIGGSINMNKNRGFITYQSHVRGKVLSSILRVAREHYTMEHPTQKPLELMRLLVKLCSNEGDLVLDPFSGGGSTVIAAKELKRDFIAIEKDEEYYNISLSRFDRHFQQEELLK